MHILRAPGGCPWDAEQTHQSLVKHLIEEAYEVAEAIRSGDRDAIVDELGDLLLQPVFHAEIASETGQFDLDDIATAISEKLIRRHPHVFGDATADDPDAVLSQWNEIKATEAGQSASAEGEASVIRKTNEGLPSLMAAQKIQKQVAKVGFDWSDVEPVLEKVREETDEVADALAGGDSGRVGEEIGDLLFAIVNLARKSGHDAEVLLHEANSKFVDRFRQCEGKFRQRGESLEDASLEEMDAVWDSVKATE